MSKTTKSSATAATGAPDTPPLGIMVAMFPLAVWLTLVPFVDASLGFFLDVTLQQEITSHVLPGIVMVGSAGAALLLRRKPWAPLVYLLAAGLAFLAGLWAFSTHVPLLAQASQGGVDWGTALFHFAPGPVVMAVALAGLVPALRTTD